MNNLKSNLHLVVLGAGILLAIILMVVGIVIRGGTESSLDAAQTKLQAAGNPPSAGDMKLATEARESFNTGIKSAEEAVTTGRGAKLGANPIDVADGGQFWTGTGKPALSELQAGFAQLEKRMALPKILARFELGTQPPVDFWGNMEREWSQLPSDRARIRQADTQIRIMREVLGAAQVVAERPAFAGESFKLIDFKFETPAMSDARSAANSPWQNYPFTVSAECSPAFSAALIEELSVPSTTANAKRQYFPVLVDKLVIEMLGRPTAVEFTIDPAVRDEYKVSDKIDPDSDEGKREAERIAKDVAEKERLTINPKMTARLLAVVVNRDWRVIKPAE